MAEVGSGGGRRVPTGSSSRAKNIGPKGIARLERQARLHERGEPCGRGDCGLVICQAARVETLRARSANRVKEQEYWHSFGKPCGQRECTVEICRQARQATKSKRKRKPDPVGANPPAPRAMTAEERRRREAHSKSLPCGVSGCAAPNCRAASQASAQARSASPASTAARTGSSQPSSAAAAKASTSARKSPRGTMICRECLRAQPVSAFPNPRARRCEDCGGQEGSSSVRTVSGGSPGLGRRR
jgi:hypothetical protein